VWLQTTPPPRLLQKSFVITMWSKDRIMQDHWSEGSRPRVAVFMRPVFLSPVDTGRRSDAICKEMESKLRRRRRAVLRTAVNRTIIIDTDARWHSAAAGQLAMLGETIAKRSVCHIRSAWSSAENKPCNAFSLVLYRTALRRFAVVQIPRILQSLQKLRQYHNKRT